MERKPEDEELGGTLVSTLHEVWKRHSEEGFLFSCNDSLLFVFHSPRGAGYAARVLARGYREHLRPSSRRSVSRLLHKDVRVGFDRLTLIIECIGTAV